MKTLTLAGVGLVTLVGVAGAVPDDSLVTSLERTGSFGLLALFFLSIIYGMKQLIPAGIAYLNSTRTEFLAELKAEREARERGLSDHRDMLSSHKHDLIATMEKQTIVIEKQNEELDRIATIFERRPCLLKKNRNEEYSES